jgi:hypothetical protein
VAPKNTILLATVVLKLVPVMETASPGLALNGVKDVMVGACACRFWEQKANETTHTINKKLRNINRDLKLILLLANWLLKTILYRDLVKIYLTLCLNIILGVDK